jgi:hypothetical protein
MLSKKITVASTDTTSRWVFYGTRPEILDWMRNHSTIQLENGLFGSNRPVTFQTQTELVIDLVYYSDPEQSMFDYLKSFVATDFDNERVKVEIRPRVDSKDQMTTTLCRVITRSGVSFAEILTELEQEWHNPSPSYFQQAQDAFNERPGPVHIVSTDAPMNIHVETE